MERYLDAERAEVLPYVPQVRSVLDVGCARGAFGDALKRRNPDTAVCGVEMDPLAAAIARGRLDRVVEGSFPAVLSAGWPSPSERFDCVTFLDCLEHLVDPWAALRATQRLLAEGGQIVASIPNVRHLRIILQLVRGHWDYQDSGILDRTHLRFFTKRTTIELFESTGFRVDIIEPINVVTTGWKARILGHLGPGITEFRATQFVVVASLVRP